MSPSCLAAQGRYLAPTCQRARSNERHRNNEAYFHTMDGAVTHQEIIEAMKNGFSRLHSFEKVTIVVMDNASVHRKAVEEVVSWEWLGWRVWVWLLLAYSPELNPMRYYGRKSNTNGYPGLPTIVLKQCAPR
ncbi:MAG: transposase [Methylobacter sp.]